MTLLHLPNILSFKILQYCERKRKDHSFFSLSSFTTLLLTVVSSFEILDLDLLWVSLLSSGCFQFSFFSLSLLGSNTVFLVVLLLSVWQSKQIMGASLLILRRWELVVGFALHPSLFTLRFSSSITVSSQFILASLLDLYRLILQELSPSSLKLLLVTRSESLLCCLRYLWLGMF